MKKRIEVSLNEDKKTIKMAGVDSNGAPFHLFPKIEVKNLGPATHTFPNTKQAKQPFTAPVPDMSPEKTFKITCQFQRNYLEPDLTFTVEMADLLE